MASEAPVPATTVSDRRGHARARAIALVGAAALLAAVLALGVARMRVPKAAPAVTLTTIDGRRIELASLRGRVVLVEFWATSCPICMREMPAVDALARELEPAGLTTVAIAMPYDRPDLVLDFAKRARPGFPIALDPMGRALEAFGPIPGTPTRFVIARDGTIAAKLIGATDPSRLRERLRALLAQPA